MVRLMAKTKKVRKRYLFIVLFFVIQQEYSIFFVRLALGCVEEIRKCFFVFLV